MIRIVRSSRSRRGRRGLAPVLAVLGLVLLAGCDEDEARGGGRVEAPPVEAEPVQAEPVQAEPVQAEPAQAAPEKPRERGAHAYEHRIAAEWKGERQEGSAVWRCAIVGEIAEVPRWVRDLGSGGGGSPYTCAGTSWVVLGYADGTRIGFLFPMPHKDVDLILGSIRKPYRRPLNPTLDGMTEDGRPRRVWFDTEASDLSDPYWTESFWIREEDAKALWPGLRTGLGLTVAVMGPDDVDPRVVWPHLPGLSEKREGAPTILKVVTQTVDADTMPTEPVPAFEDTSLTAIWRAWREGQ